MFLPALLLSYIGDFTLYEYPRVIIKITGLDLL